VTGDVRVKLHKGRAMVVGSRSPRSLYSHDLATYSKGDAFDHKSAEGFIALWGLPTRLQAQVRAAASAATAPESVR